MLMSYKTASENSIYDITWSVYGRIVPSNHIIKQWKKNADLDVSISFFVDKEKFNECISKGMEVSFYICYESLWGKNGTGLQNLAQSIAYDPKSKEDELSITSTVPGEQLAGSVKVSLIAALESSTEKKKLSVFASEKGSILYENSITIQLEGRQALFPVKAIDFSKEAGVSSTALYYLKRKFHDMDSNFTTAYCLYFNTKHPYFKKINTDTETDPESQTIIKMIMNDVYRTIVEDVLKDNDIISMTTDNPDDHDAMTLRGIYRNILINILKYIPSSSNKSIEYIQDLYNKGTEDARNTITTAIQAYILQGVEHE